MVTSFLQCKHGHKQCGKRCIPVKWECHVDGVVAAAKPRVKKPPSFKPQNLALLATATATFGGIAIGAVLVSRSKYSPAKTYQKPFTPTAEQIENAPALPDESRLVKPRQNEKLIISGDEIGASPYDRHAQAVDWAQGVVKNAENTYVFDLETANVFEGVNPLSDDYGSLAAVNPPGIVQIAIHRADGAESFNVVLDPEEAINPLSQRVHGLSRADTEGQPAFRDIYPFLKEKLEGKDLLAFNNRFDIQLFDAMCDKNGLERIAFSNREEDGHVSLQNDIMHNFGLYLGRLPKRSTGELYAKPQLPRRKDMADMGNWYDPYQDLPRNNGVKFGDAHDALEDVFAATELIFRMATRSPLKDRRSLDWQIGSKGYEDAQETEM
jgi:DNA polymerase III epsilon subunit-like protein